MRPCHRAGCGALLVTVLIAPRGFAAPCSGSLSRDDVVRCILAQSLDVRLARQELKVIAGRRISAGIWLPANPLVSFQAADRTSPDRPDQFFNWIASLGQELEVAGQRGTRLAVADTEAQAQVRRVGVTEHNVAAVALTAYFEVLAARETRALAADLGPIAQGLGSFAQERVKANLMAPVDADLLIAETTRIGELRLEADRRVANVETVLAILLGREPGRPLEVAGRLDVSDLPPPPEPLPALMTRALALRGEVAAAKADQRVASAQIAALRRARVPNPILRVFYQRDDFADQIVGGAIELPVPLPAPVGRTNAGDIAATRARAEQLQTATEQVRRQIRREVADALTAVRTRRAAVSLYQPAQLTRARADLAALRDGLATRQLSVREALLAERTLIDLLQADIAARLAYALAIVELHRVIGLPLNGESK